MTNLITEEELEARLKNSPAPRVEAEYITSRIASVQFDRVFETVTLCNIRLDNGYSVRGESACVNPENYDMEIGKKIAYDNAFRQLWPLFGFLLAEQQKVARERGNLDVKTAKAAAVAAKAKTAPKKKTKEKTKGKTKKKAKR